MKAKLLINDKEIEVEISEEMLKHLNSTTTGYERVDNTNIYFYENNGEISGVNEGNDYIDNKAYSSANYYSDRTVAENNIRADTLMRQFAN